MMERKCGDATQDIAASLSSLHEAWTVDQPAWTIASSYLPEPMPVSAKMP
jgi:hypothetical protein